MKRFILLAIAMVVAFSTNNGMAQSQQAPDLQWNLRLQRDPDFKFINDFLRPKIDIVFLNVVFDLVDDMSSSDKKAFRSALTRLSNVPLKNWNAAGEPPRVRTAITIARVAIEKRRNTKCNNELDECAETIEIMPTIMQHIDELCNIQGWTWHHTGHFGATMKILTAQAQNSTQNGQAWIDNHGVAERSVAVPKSPAKSASGTYTLYGHFFRNQGAYRNPNWQWKPDTPEVSTIRWNGKTCEISGPRPATLDYYGQICFGSDTFEVYASKSNADHLFIAPDGNVLLAVHLGLASVIRTTSLLVYDKGNTSARRSALNRQSAAAPSNAFPHLFEIGDWANSQITVPERMKMENGLPASTGVSPNSGRAARRCGVCNGTGSMVKLNLTTYGATGKKWCEECHEWVVQSHYHVPCPHCRGTGMR